MKTGPIVKLVCTSVRVAESLHISTDLPADFWLDTFERRYVADIADRIGASVTRSVRASVADSCATAGV